MTLGKYLETYARGVTASAIHKLSSLQPKTARLVLGGDEYGDESIKETNESNTSFRENDRKTNAPRHEKMDRHVDISLLQYGDVVRLVPGEIAPADGIITLSETSVPVVNVKKEKGFLISSAYIDYIYVL